MDPKDTSRQVLEVTKTSGFQTLAEEMDQEIELMEERLAERTKLLPDNAEMGINSEEEIIKLVSLTARIRGLKYMRQLIDDHREIVDKV